MLSACTEPLATFSPCMAKRSSCVRSIGCSTSAAVATTAANAQILAQAASSLRPIKAAQIELGWRKLTAGWQLEASPLLVTTAGRRLATLEAKVSPLAEPRVHHVISGKWDADHDAWAAQPGFAAIGAPPGRSSTGDFTIRTGIATEITAKTNLTGHTPERAVTASLRATLDAFGGVEFKVPLTVTFGTTKTNLSANGQWTKAKPGRHLDAELTGVEVELDHLRLLAGTVAAWGGVTLPALDDRVSSAASPSPAATPATVAPAAAKLGIRPTGDETVAIDMSRIHSDELKQIYAYIDELLDEHVMNLQRWIQQPSISNTGEGIPESADMVKGFFDQLGCQKTQVYDVGITEWGQQGNPVVYAKCDEGAEKTLVVYWMYDTMPVTQPDLWKAPPFEGRLVEQAPYKKVLIGRGATNSKGPQMVQLNALMAIKAVTGKLPVNLIFVAEGDEERMSIGYRKFVKDHPELFADADAMYRFGSQGSISGGSEGSVFVELTTSGTSWGRIYDEVVRINLRIANPRKIIES